jgi:hypothetical protein
MSKLAGLTNWVRRLSPRCNDAARVISRNADEQVPLVDRTGLLLHTLICPPCRRYQQSVRFLKQTFHHLSEKPLVSEGEGLSSDARSRIESALRASSSLDV